MSAKQELLADLCSLPGSTSSWTHLGDQVFAFEHKSEAFAVQRIAKYDLSIRRNIRTEEQVFRQKAAWQAISHPFVATCYKTLHDSHFCYFIFEFLQGGNLDHFSRGRRLDESTTRFIIGCLVAALGYIHSQGWIHGNVNLESVMIDAEGYIKLGGFDFCKRLEYGDRCPWTSMPLDCTAPPELAANKEFDHSVDWWALGTVAYVCLDANFPFPGVDVQQCYDDIVRKEVTYSEFFSKPTRNLLSGLLDKDPTKRLGSGINGADNVRQHPWFKPLDWYLLLARRLKHTLTLKSNIQSRMDTSNFDE